MPWTTPENYLFPSGDLHSHLIHGSLGPHTFIQNAMLIDSAIFALLTVECHNAQLCFPPKLTLPFAASGPPSNTWYLRPTGVIIPNCMSIGSAVFVWVPNVNPQKWPFPLGFHHPAGEGPSHGHLVNMHRKIGKDRTCSSGDIPVNRQTDTQTRSSQYFVIAPRVTVK